MKKWMALLLLACLLGAGASAEQVIAVIDAGETRLHLRAAPGEDAQSLGLFYTGAQVVCLQAPSDEWTPVQIGGVQGYMASRYLRTGSAAMQVVSRQIAGFTTAKTSANVRSAPGMEGEIIGRVMPNERFKILGEMANGWWCILHGEQPGFISGSLVKLDTPKEGLVVGEFAVRTVQFPAGKSYPVYYGPGEQYARCADGQASVSTNGWIQVLGEEDGWVMIHYGIDVSRGRIGWIHASLPDGVTAKRPRYEMIKQTITADCALTDDPLGAAQPIAYLAAGMKVLALADFGEYFYIEMELDGQLVRGFVDIDCISKG